MKLLQNGVASEPEQPDSGRTVLVGMKLDSHSRELLTWALVKVAQPGDLVIALHVLGNGEVVNQDGKSSLLSIVKAFDSVLAVYEGFCNLKQVDLKLKICRGASARKILVREAKSYSATNVIVGTARKHHKIRSSTSVAKYCAKKLPKDCWVLAVHNGKVIFEREGCPLTTGDCQGNEERRGSSLFGAVYGSSGSPLKVQSSESFASLLARDKFNLVIGQDSDQSLAKATMDSSKIVDKQNCSICGPESNSVEQSAEISSENGDEHDESLAIVPVQKVKVASTSISTLIRQLPEVKPGWPLLRHVDQSGRKTSSNRSSGKQISVVQWAMRLPSRSPSYPAALEYKPNTSGQCLDGENGAMVLVGAEGVTSLLSPDSDSETLPKELEGFHEKYSSTCRLFNYQELLIATSNFLPENLIGKGGSSQVFRGCLPDGKEVAVKILKLSEEVLKEFIMEIEIITSLSHKNIISLLGFCFENRKFLLVYDFLSRGSLEEILHGISKNPNAFIWSERFKVAVGVAEALDYLHSDSQRVIHRDVKSSNVLLSDDFEPQLSDFGLAKRASTSSHVTCTDVAGTFGYLAPEYFMYGKVNDKIDVYAYGVVLLELLSGRKPISTDYPKGQESLVMWARPILIDAKVSRLLDPSLGCDYDQDEMERVVLAASLCIRRAPRARPPISLVLKLLQGDIDVTKWARQQINALGDCNTLDEEVCPRSDIQSHLNLALLDVDDDSLSLSSIEQSISLEDYLQGRWSRSSSFD
ncbi:probable receptor-like serine/threonine-protein kinase At5g57670 isoform X2 [Momordica charantia]|uniref:Probable receptor-like serine/threonine-protein kinase At5g57670 isoform X2 n=1 Tax=Momordica charantia TaxID=3673 RepID=A0A6J1CK24_MOMCH|nr:probable receptor-like serine/threonine-protein kinase At5g57670 isoform X2 [Momordica charantia]